MPSFQIQFQHDMSITEFLRCFGTEAQCAVAVKQSRWPQGFRCVEHTTLPLTIWFLAIYLLSQAKTGRSALALMRQLGVSYPTAWLLHHKINRAIAQRDDVQQLPGAVQLDDAYVGGERAGGKPGRGSENKLPFVAAVSVDAKSRPLYIKLHLVTGFTSEAISRWAKAALVPGTLVKNDGLACFAAVIDAGFVHVPTVVGALKPRDLPEFKWVYTILGNLKTTLPGTFHSLNYRKYA